MGPCVPFHGLADQPSLALAIEEGIGDHVNGGWVPTRSLQPQTNGAVRKAVLELDAAETFLGTGEDNTAIFQEGSGGILIERADSEYAHGILFPAEWRLPSRLLLENRPSLQPC